MDNSKKWHTDASERNRQNVCVQGRQRDRVSERERGRVLRTIDWSGDKMQLSALWLKIVHKGSEQDEPEMPRKMMGY